MSNPIEVSMNHGPYQMETGGGRVPPCSCEKAGDCPRMKRRMVGRLFELCQHDERYRALFEEQARSVSPIHENVVLSEEGVKIWEQAADSQSRVGKPKVSIGELAARRKG